MNPTTGYRLTLPVEWEVIDLTDPDGRRKMIGALVDRQIGRADEKARLRRGLRGELERQGDRAAEAGAWVMAFMFLTVAEAPIPASLTGYRTPGTFALGGFEALAKAMADNLTGGRVDRGEGPFGQVLRSVRYTRTPVPGTDDGASVLVVDYWCDPGDGNLVELSFSSPTVALEDALVDLFDAIAGTLRLLDRDPPTAGAAGDPDPIVHPQREEAAP